MPRDLFQGSPESSSTLARRAGLVPISIGAHVIVIGAAVLVPALAIGALPDPRASLAYVAHDILLPAVPVAPTLTAGRPAPRPGVPIDAPSTLPPLDYEPPRLERFVRRPSPTAGFRSARAASRADWSARSPSSRRRRLHRSGWCASAATSALR